MYANKLPSSYVLHIHFPDDQPDENDGKLAIFPLNCNCTCINPTIFNLCAVLLETNNKKIKIKQYEANSCIFQ